MTPVDVMSGTYIDFDKNNNKEDPKFKFGHHIKISKCKHFLQKVTFQIGLKKFL